MGLFAEKHTSQNLRYYYVITEIGKPVICRWYHHRGTITDITKTVCQVKKILNLIFAKLFEPTSTLIEE